MGYKKKGKGTWAVCDIPLSGNARSHSTAPKSIGSTRVPRTSGNLGRESGGASISRMPLRPRRYDEVSSGSSPTPTPIRPRRSPGSSTAPTPLRPHRCDCVCASSSTTPMPLRPERLVAGPDAAPAPASRRGLVRPVADSNAAQAPVTRDEVSFSSSTAPTPLAPAPAPRRSFLMKPPGSSLSKPAMPIGF